MTRIWVVAGAVLALARPAIADGDDDGDIEMDGNIEVPPDDGTPPAPPPKKPPKPPLEKFARPAPPHLAAFAAAWQRARSCVVGAPPWVADPSEARGIAAATGAGSCGPELAAAIAAARAGDADAGYHLAWYRTIELVDSFETDRDFAGGLQALDKRLFTTIGMPLPDATRLAAPRALVLANLQTDSDGSTRIGDDATPWEHAVEFPYTRNGRDSGYGIADPDPKSPFPTGWAKAWHATPTQAGIVVDAPAQTLATLKAQEIIGAFGEGAERAIVFQDGAIGVVHSHDGGAHWDEAHVDRIAIGPDTTGPTAHKRMGTPVVDVTWEAFTRYDGYAVAAGRWVVIDGTQPIGAVRDLGTGGVGRICGTAAGLWQVHDDTLRFADATGTGPPREVARFHGNTEVVACAADHVAIATGGRDDRELIVCDHATCGARAPAAGATRVYADVTPRGELDYALVFDGGTPGTELLVAGSANPARAGRVVRVAGKVIAAAAFHGAQFHVVVANPQGFFVEPVLP